jgi:hypothetical protein
MLRCPVATLLLVGLLPAATHAEISRIDNFRVLGYLQPNANVLDFQGGFFTSSLITTDDNEFNTVTMSFPGPSSSQVLLQDTTTIYRYFSPFFFNSNDLASEYPFGTYRYLGLGELAPGSASVEYDANYFPVSIPFLEADSYNAAQGLNPGADFFFDFVPYLPNVNADESLIFFSIFDTTDNVVAFESFFLPSTTDGVTVPAGTLTPTHSFQYRLVYSDRKSAVGTGAIFSPVLAFDYYTEGTFTTAIPEASSWGLSAIAMLLWIAGRVVPSRMVRSAKN